LGSPTACQQQCVQSCLSAVMLTLFVTCLSVFVCASACVSARTWAPPAAVVVDARFRVPAVDLLFADGRGGSLANRTPVDGDAGLGSGFFGKVCTFTRHGAAVAVKELKAGSLDAASIGTRCVFFLHQLCLSDVGVCVRCRARVRGCGLLNTVTMLLLCPANEVNISMAIRPAQNVVTLFGVCDDALDGKLRIVMELCTHGSLRDYVKALPPTQVCGFPCMCVWLVRCTYRSDGAFLWSCVSSGTPPQRRTCSCSWRVE
jgi:hypothetical protein